MSSPIHKMMFFILNFKSFICRQAQLRVAPRAALSAAPEPRLRRVSAIRLQSLTQETAAVISRAPRIGNAPERLASITIAPTPVRWGSAARSITRQAAEKRREPRIGVASQGIHAAPHGQSLGSAERDQCREEAKNWAERRARPPGGERGHDDEDQAVKHRPAKPAPFPFSSGEAQGCPPLPYFPDFLKRALHPRSRLAWV